MIIGVAGMIIYDRLLRSLVRRSAMKSHQYNYDGDGVDGDSDENAMYTIF
jgi:hypothetical protein